MSWKSLIQQFKDLQDIQEIHNRNSIYLESIGKYKNATKKFPGYPEQSREMMFCWWPCALERASVSHAHETHRRLLSFHLFCHRARLYLARLLSYRRYGRRCIDKGLTITQGQTLCFSFGTRIGLRGSVGLFSSLVARPQTSIVWFPSFIIWTRILRIYCLLYSDTYLSAFVICWGEISSLS